MLRGHRGLLVVGVLVVVVVLFGSAPVSAALVDDFETDFWLPYTHFLLGDQASAGYSNEIARSGARSFHVDIHGYSILDFGSAYGYAVYPTRGAPITELRVSLFLDQILDTSSSSRDAYAAGVAIDLLDAEYRNLARLRYIASYQESRRFALCGPTQSDVVLPAADVGTWTDLGRIPAVDFPAAPWQGAEFVRISIGFLCTAGLKGAHYSLYFDDFMLHTGAGDSDADGLSDLEEEARMYAISVVSGSVPAPLPSSGAATVDLLTPAVTGEVQWAGIALELNHPNPDDLSVELILPEGDADRAALLWDPGFEVRGAGILEPAPGDAVHGSVSVRGMAWRPNPVVQFYVDDLWVSESRGDATGGFVVPWSSDDWSEGVHRLRVEVQAIDGGQPASRASTEVPVAVDRTPPILEVLRPTDHERVHGLTVVEAGAHDDQGLAAVTFSVDGVPVETRHEEPFTFFFETADLLPGTHTFGVRAVDRAGNEAVHVVSVRVGLSWEGVPLPCRPVCNLDSESTTANLPPLVGGSTPLVVPLPSGDRLEVVDAFRSPWTPHVVRTDAGVTLLLAAARDPHPSDSDGVVRSTFELTDFLDVSQVRIVVRDHGDRPEGSILSARVLVAVRSSPAASDTDGDGLPDGYERTSVGTIPVLADVDADMIPDGSERAVREVTFVIDGEPYPRTVWTDPLDFDTDDDGLADGLELFPGDGQSPSDPMVPDTDGDGLVDGDERRVHGSDPTLTDTDGDTLSDFDEVTPRALTLTIDGVPVTRSITTFPHSIDTDGDELTDPQEWAGSSLYTYATDPSDDDTDDDGLSDGAEVTSLAGDLTSPVDSDSDRDGIKDGLDLAAVHAWDFPWSTVYGTGLLRFNQDVHAYGVHGLAAWVFEYNYLTGECEFIADHVASATRSSDESTVSAMNQMNQVFSDGGEAAFRAIGAGSPSLFGEGSVEFVYGACDFLHPKKYVITYLQDNHIYPMEFINVQSRTLTDDAGDPFYHAVVDVPLNASRSQTIVIQVTIRADADRTATASDAPTTLPSLAYVLNNGRDFLGVRPFYRNLAVGAPIDDHAYAFTLRVPASAVPDSNLFWKHGVPHATLVLTPLWLTIDGATRTKAALDASAMTIGAAVVRVSEHAERLVVRLAHDVGAIQTVLPADIATYETGYHTFGSYSVYVYRLGTSFDEESLTRADALYVIGGSQEDIDTFQGQAPWTPTWRIQVVDGFDNAAWIFKAVRYSLSVSRQLFDRVYEPVPDIIQSTLDEDRFNYGYIAVERTRNLETLADEYVVSVRLLKIGQSTSPHPEFPWITRTDEAILDEDAVVEIVNDPDEATLLDDSRHAAIRTRLRGVGAGAVAVIWGGQAVLAYKDGDVIKGTVFLAAGAVGVFGVVKSEVLLVRNAFRGQFLSKGITLKLGAAAAIATGGILAGYQLFLSSQTSDPIEKLSHYEAAAATVADTAISLVPLYGPIFELTWVLTTVGIATLGPLLGHVPDDLALKIVSSPGTTIVFLIEYFFTSEVPSDIAKDALNRLLEFLIEGATFANASTNPLPTIVLFPAA